MSELYERLLGEVKTLADYAPQPSGALAALLAVLELHQPREARGATQCGECADQCHSSSGLGCDWPDAYPCSTVRAIARALDVPIGDQQ